MAGANPRGDLRPYTTPLTRSIAFPVGRLIPSRSGPKIAPAQHLGTEDNVNDRANPYSGAYPFGVTALDPRVHAEGCEYGPIASIHNARATGAPIAPRTARGQAYVTPPALWNLSGIAERFIQVIKAPTNTVKLATGRWTPFDRTATHPLPGLPEPGRMIRPKLPMQGH
jgi:hypothetical protein